MCKLLTLFLCLAFACVSFGQTKISGTIKQPDLSILSYVNIGIKLKNAGTVSNENGQFELDVPKQFLNDTLTFSYVGFQELNIPIQTILNSSMHVFLLKPKTQQLTEVVVTSKKLKQKKIGTKSHNPFLTGNVESKDKKDIIEFAKFINIQNKTSEIQSVSIYLLGVNLDTATFRINFYDIKNELPGNKIVDVNILERMPVKKGWLTIDLSKENIILNKNFFVGFEFIPERKLPKYSISYGGQFGGNYITRESSLGTWEKGKGVSLSAYVTLLQ